MPICLALDTLVGEVDECVVTVVVYVRRPWRRFGDPCLPEGKAAVLALATQIGTVLTTAFPLASRPADPVQ